MEIIYYIWYDLPDMVNIPVENQRSISASIKPSLGVRGQEILEGGGGGARGKTERKSLSPLHSFLFLFPLEMPDTQANVQ